MQPCVGRHNLLKWTKYCFVLISKMKLYFSRNRRLGLFQLSCTFSNGFLVCENVETGKVAICLRIKVISLFFVGLKLASSKIKFRVTLNIKDQEFHLTITSSTYSEPKKVKKGYGIPNSELLPLKWPLQFHEQKFGIGISIDRSLGPQIPYIESHSN